MSEKIEYARRGMSPEMRQGFDDFFENEERLTREWTLCTQQYDQSLALTDNRVEFASRMMFGTLVKYWSDRKSALERSIQLVKPELLEKLKVPKNG